MAQVRTRKRLIGTFLAGLVCLAGASIGWPPWGPESHIRWWSVVLRVSFFSAAVVFYVKFLKAWLTVHAESVHPRSKVGYEQYPELGLLDDQGYFERVEEHAHLFRNLDVENARMLRRHLLEPETFRRKVTEDMEIRLQQFIRTVEIEWDPGAIPHIGSSVVLPIMRRPNSSPLRELTVAGGRLLNSMETRALLVRIAELLDIPAPDFAQQVEGIGADPAARTTETRADGADQGRESAADVVEGAGQDSEGVRRKLMAMVRGGTTRQRDRLVSSRVAAGRRKLRSRSGDTDELEGVGISEESKRLFRAARETRHYVAWYEGTLFEGKSIIQYRSDPDRPDRWPVVDAWRARKDRWRTRLRMPRRFVYIRLDKALSSHTYFLKVRCNEDLYFEEANIWVGGDRRWLKESEPFALYRSHIYWEPPSGKSFASLTASRISGQLPWKSLFFALRLTEKPPGILGSATAISFTSLASVWLVGALGGGTDNIDPVAFILAMPGLAASLLGFSTAGAIKGRRSGTGIGALAASMVISLLGVVLFVSEARHQSPLKPWHIDVGHDPVSVLWMQDLWWLPLVVLAGCVFLVTLGTLIMRVQRYAVLAGVRSDRNVVSATD